jgi:hypothetical protein
VFTFRSGAFNGLTVEQAMLRDAPRLYDLAKWAKNKPNLGRMLWDFELLRRKLLKAPVTTNCAAPNCRNEALWMTFPIGKDGYFWRGPYYWCNRHEPWRESKVSPKVRVHFDAMRHFRTAGDKDAVFISVRRALGIKKGTKITQEFAHRYFSKLK